MTGRLQNRLALVTDVTCISRNVTAYADDFQAAHTAHNLHDLRTAERFPSQFFEILLQAGMTINAAKSAIVCRFKGSFAERCLRQHTRQGPDGPLFRVRTESSRLLEFPIVESHAYLGTKISYTDPRTQTLLYRMGLATVEWSRLRKLVCSKQGVYRRDRSWIWYSSVLPTLLYGLAAAGLPAGGGQQLRAMYMRHLRAVLRCLLSHTSNREVVSRVGLPDICATLESEIHRLCNSVRQQLAQNDSLMVSDAVHGPCTHAICPRHTATWLSSACLSAIGCHTH